MVVGIGWLAALVLATLCANWLFRSAGPHQWFVDKDFANYWVAARLAVSNDVGLLFGPDENYLAYLRDLFGPDYPWRNWSYPPHYLLFIWPIGYLSYPTAFTLFLAVSLAAFLVTARLWLGRFDGPAIANLSIFIIANLMAAQNGFLTGALMLGALALRYHRPVLAGVLAGCLTIKPQLGIMLPILFMIERRWLTIFVAALTAAMLVALSAYVFGIDAWRGYLNETLPTQADVMYHATGIFTLMLPSVFGSLRQLGIAPDVAIAAHIAFALPVFVVAIVMMVRTNDRTMRAVVAVMATFMVTPYSLVYDLGPLSVAALLLNSRLVAAGSGNSATHLVILVLGLTPMLTLLLGYLHFPTTPLIFLAAFAILFNALRNRATFREQQAPRRTAPGAVSG